MMLNGKAENIQGFNGLEKGGAEGMDELYTVDEIMAKLKVSRQTLYRMMKNGFPYVQISGQRRFFGSQVMKYLRDSQVRQIQQAVRS